MSEVRNEGSRASVVWTVEGVEHDRVDNFYTDDTGATAVKCHYDCMCKKKKKEEEENDG